jgi:transposase
MIETFFYLNQVIQEKGASIRRLRNMLFGSKTESSDNVLGQTESSDKDEQSSNRESSSPDNSTSHNSASDEPASDDSTDSVPESSKKSKPKKGHGRNGADAYTGAPRVEVDHEGLKPGDPCPECPKGKVYKLREPSKVVSVVGKPPVDATVYELERLRCNLCGRVFTAKMPEDVPEEKYDITAGSIIVLLKYGCGFPFYRLEKFQETLGIPLPDSTQWDVVEEVANRIHPVFIELAHQAAQGQIVHNDDTTIKILSLMKEIQEEQRERTGIFTTAVLSHLEDGHSVVIFFTGAKHAGENLDDLLQQRSGDLPPPIQMCDASSRNVPEQGETLLCYCLSHGRRKFVEIINNFPKECRRVIEDIGKIYHHDAITKEKEMSPEERLEYHQRHSGPVVDKLKEWCTKQLEQKKVEPNSGLGKAIQHLLNHWKEFTLFLRVPGAPLDNNLCEQCLKRIILHRKNALFFKTEHGAYVGDLFISLIHTCSLNGVNPFEYLNALQEHSAELRKEPQKWLPWNYRQNLDSQNQSSKE